MLTGDVTRIKDALKQGRYGDLTANDWDQARKIYFDIFKEKKTVASPETGIVHEKEVIDHDAWTIDGTIKQLKKHKII